MSTEITDAPPPEVPAVIPDAAPPWHSTVSAPDKPGELTAEWWLKAPEEERSEWARYKDAKTPMDIALKASARVKEAQTELRNKIAVANNLPPKPEGDAATPEAMAEYYKARNLPADPKEYGITKPDDLPDEIWAAAKMDTWAALLHRLEVSPDAAKELIGYWNQQAREALTLHSQQVAQQKEAEKAARAAYIQGEKELLVKSLGQRVDPALGAIVKLGEVTGYDKEYLNPDNPEKYVGHDTVKFLESLVNLIPKTGDPTRRALAGGPNASSTKDRAYYQSLTKDHDDYKALQSSSHPRHKEVYNDRARAYALDAELNQK